MRRSRWPFALLLLAVVLAACTSSSGGPSCSFDDPAVLASSSWPKFRHDAQNTGSVSNALLVTNAGQSRWVFPPLDQAVKGPFAASPAIDAAGSVVYIGSTDGIVYAINVADGSAHTAFGFNPALSITSTAVVAVRDSNDALFVGAGDGLLYAVDGTGTAQASDWPTSVSGFLSASPNLSKSDGTIFAASLNGSLVGICPNGIERFILSATGIASSPALDAGDNVYIGADDHQLRALKGDGTVLWAFSASAPILTAPVVDSIASGLAQDIGTTDAPVPLDDVIGFPANGTVLIDQEELSYGAIEIAATQLTGIRRGVNNTTTVAHQAGARVVSVGLPRAVYVADAGGGVFKVDQQGRPIPPFAFPGAGPIRSSPALAGTHLYFGSDDGNVYAIDTTTGSIDWTFPTAAAVLSSPAVATNGTAPAALVVGSNDGNVYVLQDNGSSVTQLVKFRIGASVRSSPAIGSDGTVYVGADDGRVYAIGAAG